MAPALEKISPAEWLALMQAIEQSSQKVTGVSPEYVAETKRFAQELHEALVKGNRTERPWLATFRTPAEFEADYCRKIYDTIEQYLRGEGGQDLKRTIIGLAHYFKQANRHYPAIFPVTEERINKEGITDAGNSYVRLTVLLPNGTRIPLNGS
jgi:hypothetical protein